VAGLATLSLLAVAAVGGATRAPAAASKPAGLLPRTLNWSDHTWQVFADLQQGPERVPLTNSPAAAYVDSRGRLHLNIIKSGGVWRSVELDTASPLGYGTYTMKVDTATAKFDQWVVLGMFVWKPGATPFRNELDIEDSRFPNLQQAPKNAQFAVQPYYEKNHRRGYYIKPSHHHLFQQFTWLPGHHGNGVAKFETRAGSTAHSPLIAKWVYKGKSVPKPNNLHLYLTLWMNHGKAPKHGTHSAIIRSFSFKPAS
jgi:hypothetical protein